MITEAPTPIDSTIQILGALPLMKGHMCFEGGHNMFSVYAFHGHQSSWGKHKCSRCGYEEEWQYDFQHTNPMYQQNQ